MRVQISVPNELWLQLSNLAARECRDPRRQLEFMVRRALEAESNDQRQQARPEVTHAWGPT